MTDVSSALARLREGTEVLRTGGGAKLSVAECNAILGALDAAHTGLKRALDFRTATPEGLDIKNDVRIALVDSGCPAGEWGEVGS